MGDDGNPHVVARSCDTATGTEFVFTAAAPAGNHFPALVDVRSPVVYQDFDGGAGPFPAASQTLHPFTEFPPPVQRNIPNPMILQYSNPSVGISSPNFTCANDSHHQSSRPRKRKISKRICQMTAAELSADSWAWRKYGQKPIKGSRYPRNYYRCSKSKGCAARRQVERSADAPGLFIVSYTGEHTHARPSQRTYLAGTSRGKVAAAAKVKEKGGKGKNNDTFMKAGSTASPTTKGSAVKQNDVVNMGAEEEEKLDEENTTSIPYNDDDVEENVMIGFENHPHCSASQG